MKFGQNRRFYQSIKKVVDFIDKDDENVLIHCQMGVSRSPSILLAYMMAKEMGNIDYLVKSIIKERLIAFGGGSVQIYRDTILEYFG